MEKIDGYYTKESIRKDVPKPEMIPNPLTNKKLTEILMSFDGRSNFDLAMAELLRHGFESKEITIERAHRGNLLDTTLKSASKVAEGATIGIILGAILGAIMGYYGAFGEDFFSGTPSYAAAAGSVIGVMIGVVVGALIGLSINEYNVADYSTSLGEGNVLVHLHIDDTERGYRAIHLLESYGAKLISRNARFNYVA